MGTIFSARDFPMFGVKTMFLLLPLNAMYEFSPGLFLFVVTKTKQNWKHWTGLLYTTHCIGPFSSWSLPLHCRFFCLFVMFFLISCILCIKCILPGPVTLLYSSVLFWNWLCTWHGLTGGKTVSFYIFNHFIKVEDRMNIPV